MPMIDRKLVDSLHEEFPDVTRDELVRSDFERAFLSPYGGRIGKRLTEQYRMHPAICDLVSQCFYEPNAVRLSTSKARTAPVEITADAPKILRRPICWIDTSVLSNRREYRLPNSTTFCNEAEVESVVSVLDAIAQNANLVNRLMKGEQETPIGVVCMYSGQKRRMEVACARHAWAPAFRRLLRVDTVDAYQGKENTIVILSPVRSNTNGISGHVQSPNRCNVAISRAQERLVIVGDCGMWGAVNERNPMRQILKYIREHTEIADVVSAGAVQ
jgi:superfamily I DNA and/or RNA helicase